jgi:hypothetical protein
MSLLYCYGVIGEEGKKLVLDKTGFQDNPIYTIAFKDVLAVVCEVSEEEFSQEAVDKNVKDMLWLTQNAPLHEEIVTRIMQTTTILPMKFCTIFKDKEHLKQMLEDKYADIKYFLHHVHGKAEMSLKVYSNLVELKERIKTEDDGILKLEQKAATKTPGQAYFVKQKIDILLKEKVRTQIMAEKKKIMTQIQGLFVEIKKNDVLARKVTGRDVSSEMVLNLALLVQKEHISDLNKLVQGLREELVMYKLELSGPYAAYNFIK